MKQLIDLQKNDSETALEQIKECVKQLYCKKVKGDQLAKMQEKVEQEFGTASKDGSSPDETSVPQKSNEDKPAEKEAASSTTVMIDTTD